MRAAVEAGADMAFIESLVSGESLQMLARELAPQPVFAVFENVRRTITVLTIILTISEPKMLSNKPI